MDALARYNKAIWEELARSNVEYSRPWLDLDQSSAREKVDLYGMMKEIAGKRVLCLAGGGGQQSAAFGLLGAQVTVFDLSETQLARDHLAAEHYGLQIRTVQGDIRDLSQLDDSGFDLVWQGYSINFVPDVNTVFEGIARVIRPGGLYYLMFGNPFTLHSVDEETWDGESYPLRYPYIDGAEITGLNPNWAFWDVQTEDGEWIKVESPKEFRHTLSTLLNGLIRQGFVILGIWEESSGDPLAEPGSWAHFKSFAPPYLLGMFGFELEILVLPLAVQEMVMALWLIVKGFNPSAIASLSAKETL
jgi:SAM-dependent methyltransferase